MGPGKWLARCWAKIWDDPVALTALILSLFAAGAEVLAWARGPSVTLIAPDKVALYLDATPDRSLVFLRVAADMSYANVAQSPYGTLVTVERATLSVGSEASHQRWNAFGTIDRDRVTETARSAPQALAGQSAVTHFTLFTPVPLECPAHASGCNAMADYMTVSEFKKQLAATTELRFVFQIELISGKPLEQSCYVPLSPSAREQLDRFLQLRTPYFYAMCHAAARR